MFNPIHKIKNFVITHKEAIVVGAVLGSLLALAMHGNQEVSKFLTEKGLYEEYYHYNEI